MVVNHQIFVFELFFDVSKIEGEFRVIKKSGHFFHGFYCDFF
jgi:hypothetical protein